MNKLLYGKDTRTNVVGIELQDNTAKIYYSDGSDDSETFERYILYTRPVLNGRVGELSGKQDFKYFAKYETLSDYKQARRQAIYPNYFAPRDDQQAYMLRTGVTMYKGMRYEDLRILSVDIETNGIVMDKNSQIYIISVCLQENSARKTKTFRVDHYENQKDMILDFVKYIQKVDPHVITGHNVISFDLPYIKHCLGKPLQIGKDNKAMIIHQKTRLFRKDGHRQYDFNNVRIPGREIVDTFYLAMKYDFQNKYESYGLKKIIEQERLVEEGRQFYDAANIKNDWIDISKRDRIEKYCIDDSKDSLQLCDLMLPNYFYSVQMLPVGLQETILTASGSQINSLMVRSYLQERSSIPKASSNNKFKGAISFGNQGLYSHVNKVDVASLYPSIILQYKIYDKQKDVNGNFLSVVKDLTELRLKNKQLAQDTSKRYYKDMEQAQKILINSAYGFMGAPGLNFNSPANAARVTELGREILTKGIEWVKSNDYTLVNVDTDSFSYTTGYRLDTNTFNKHINNINNLFPSNIRWENDGQYKRVIIVKAKNYVLKDYNGNVTIKGSGLKATMKEPALKEMLERMIEAMLNNQFAKLKYIYNEYAKEILNITDINRWCSKKTITKSVLNPTRTNEQRIKDALNHDDYNEGDRIYVFFDTAKSLCLNTNYTGIYDKDKLLEKLFKTVKILETVIDIQQFPNYKLKKNKGLLEDLTQLELAL